MMTVATLNHFRDLEGSPKTLIDNRKRGVE
jgi:hypothetical protein